MRGVQPLALCSQGDENELPALKKRGVTKAASPWEQNEKTLPPASGQRADVESEFPSFVWYEVSKWIPSEQVKTCPELVKLGGPQVP